MLLGDRFEICKFW